MVEPSGDTISLSKPAGYAIKMKRETKALQHMMYEWTGEGDRVDKPELPHHRYEGVVGTLRIPANIARD